MTTIEHIIGKCTTNVQSTIGVNLPYMHYSGKFTTIWNQKMPLTISGKFTTVLKTYKSAVSNHFPLLTNKSPFLLNQKKNIHFPFLTNK